MTLLHDELEAYYEFGWEGQIAFAFQFEGNKIPLFLKDGQFLTVFDPEEEILWSGKIQFVKRGYFDEHKLNA
jgi:hypothetical protein